MFSITSLAKGVTDFSNVVRPKSLKKTFDPESRSSKVAVGA